MDRPLSQRASERHSQHDYQAPSPAAYPQAFPPSTAQPPIQFSFADPFQANKDPFLSRTVEWREASAPAGRAWPTSQGQTVPNGHIHHSPPPYPNPLRPPPPPAPPANGTAPMSLPYDPSRRGSLGASGSPPQLSQGPLEPLPAPPQFQVRHMPPPSPPQPPHSVSSLPGSAPRGPPTTSPFPGARDLASYASSRPPGGMSISSILGGTDEKKAHGSPPSSTPKSMPPPSPGRARSSSMREGFTRGIKDGTPTRGLVAEQPRPASTTLGHDRTVSEPRREALFASPQFRSEPLNNFRAFQPVQHEVRPDLNGHEPPRRPGSQPSGPAVPSGEKEAAQRDFGRDGRYGAFRSFAEPHAPPPQHETVARPEVDLYQNGHRPGPSRAEYAMHSSPHAQHQEQLPTGVHRYHPGAFGTPMREEQAGLFRPAYPTVSEPIREPIESRQPPDAQPRPPQSSPPMSEFSSFDRNRGSLPDRPVTFEEHQRMEALQREQQRKASDGSLHRAVFNISPEVNRKGRNSPLPQAVQGAQPRHIGPGGDNPNVQMAFGRMFSGLGSGVGTSTPNAGHANGTATPPRMTPVRQVETGDLVRTAVDQIEGGRRSTKADGRSGKKPGRRSRDEEEKVNGRETPDNERANKRAKTNHSAHHHHHTHHHHHHHQAADNTPNPFNTIRFQPSQLSHSNLVANPTSHHHHHHHGSHAHAGHHHHHAPRSAPPLPRKPTTNVMSRRLVEDCAKKPRKHLGSQLYSIELAPPPAADTHFEARSKFSSKMTPIPDFEGKENCTYTVRVPRHFLAMRSDSSDAPGYLEEICRRRQLWGTDVYTDDSDVVAAAVHSGWLKGDFGDLNDDLRQADAGNESEPEEGQEEKPPTKLAIRPRRSVRVPPERDAHITLLLLPPLESYASTNQHHIWSRKWDRTHDGMSFMIERIEFVDEGAASRTIERGASARKARIAAEEAKRREAAAGLLMFAHAAASGAERVSVGS